MSNVQDINLTQPRDWNPSPETIAQMRAAINREAYPPAQRSGVGAALRRGR